MSFLPRTAVSVLTLLTVLLLASCGASTDDDDGSTQTTPSATSSTEPDDITDAEQTAKAVQAVDVSFPTDGFDLAGTLLLPVDDQPVPAIVLIGGSGPNHRDSPAPGQLNMGFGFTIPVFAELAEAFAEAGYAVLRYDKRSCGPFNNCSDNGYPLPSDDVLVTDFLTDATAAIDYLRTREEVDPASINVLGHSQGASLVPLLLEADSELANGILIGATFRPIDEILRHQLDSTIELLVNTGQMSRSEALALPAVAQLGEMVDGVDTIRSGSTDEVGGVSAAFWSSWFELSDNAITAATSVDQPLLVVGGDMDWNVPPTEIQAWASHLQGNDRHQVEILACVTHALNCVSNRNPSTITPADIGKTVDPSVTNTIIDFLTNSSS